MAACDCLARLRVDGLYHFAPRVNRTVSLRSECSCFWFFISLTLLFTSATLLFASVWPVSVGSARPGCLPLCALVGWLCGLVA